MTSLTGRYIYLAPCPSDRVILIPVAPGHTTMPAARRPDNFRFNARNVFLTYPQSGAITPQQLGLHLQTIRPTVYVHVTREQHAEQGLHLHALVQFVDKFNSHNPRIFDFEGKHPNIVVPRDIVGTVNYIRKNITPLNEETSEYKQGVIRSQASSAKESLWAIARDAVTEQECLAACSQASPRDWILHHSHILDYARTKASITPEYVTPNGYTFNVPENIADWTNTEFRNPVSSTYPDSLEFFPLLTETRTDPVRWSWWDQVD